MYPDDNHENRGSSIVDVLLLIFGIIFLIGFIRSAFTRTGAITIGAFLLFILIVAGLRNNPSTASADTATGSETYAPTPKPRSKKQVTPAVQTIARPLVETTETPLFENASARLENDTSPPTVDTVVAASSVQPDTVETKPKEKFLKRLFRKKQHD